ncbi:MAG: hypothetical protein U5K69_29775 [Balneolaceae bacterium]|nr:hypothetical protein [Balneolaceae bacterium]
MNTIPGSFSFYLWEESDISIMELMLELIDIGPETTPAKNSGGFAVMKRTC